MKKVDFKYLIYILKKLRDNKVLDVDLEELAKITKNYTGADIESLVKLACSNALS